MAKRNKNTPWKYVAGRKRSKSPGRKYVKKAKRINMRKARRKKRSPRAVALISKVATKVVDKYISKKFEAKAIKGRTPYDFNYQFTGLSMNCDTNLSIGRCGATASPGMHQDENWTCFPIDLSEQKEYNGVTDYIIKRDGAQIRVTKIADAGRLRITWPSVGANAALASLPRQRIDHFTFLLQFRSKAYGVEFCANNTAGNEYRRLVMAVILTTNKPAIVPTTSPPTTDTLVGDTWLSGENYSKAMQRPLHEEDDLYTEVRTQFKVLAMKKRSYYRPRQNPSYANQPHDITISESISAAAPPPLIETVAGTHSVPLNDSIVQAEQCITEHNYNFVKMFKGGKILRYEDATDADESIDFSMKPMVLVHVMRSQGNDTSNSYTATVSQCYGARSVYFKDN